MTRRLGVGMFVLAVALGAFPLADAGAAPAAAGARAQSCVEYVPRDLAINVPAAAPGQTIVVTGYAYPGDTVTIRISTFGGPPIVLGTAVAGPDGAFSATVTIPSTLIEGTYNITVSSPNCPTESTISIVVRNPRGTCTDRKSIVARRGDVITWDLLGRLDTTKPVTVLLVPVNGGPTIEVYSGPYPASGQVVFTVPASAPNGRYRIVESGTNRRGRPVSARCGTLRIRGGGGGTTTTTTTTTTTPPSTCTTVDFDSDRMKEPANRYSRAIPVSLAPGAYSVPQATAADSYFGRQLVEETSEIWELEFLDASENLLVTGGHTEDLEDFVMSATWTGSLGDVTLPAGVAFVRAHLRPDIFPDGSLNSVRAVSVVICPPGGTPPSTTTTPPTTAPPTTVPGTCQTFQVMDKLGSKDLFDPWTPYSDTIPVLLPAGTYSIPEAYSYESYWSRIYDTESSEIWELEFVDINGNVVATSSGHTGDLPDKVLVGEWVGSLGTVTIPALAAPGVVGVRAHHRPDIFPDTSNNSVIPVSFTICPPDTTPTTAPPTTATPTTEPPTTAPGTTEPGSTVPPTTGPATTVPGTTCQTIQIKGAYAGEKLVDPTPKYSSIMPITLPAGTYNIPEAISSDGYFGRQLVVQTSEIWDVQFLDAGGNVVATSDHTDDLEDFVTDAEWKGPLGSIEIPAGVVSLRAHHRPDVFPDGSYNSVLPVSIIICRDESSTPTTAPATTAAPTTAAPTTAAPTTAAPTTEPPTTEPPTTEPPTTKAPIVAPTTSPSDVLGTGIERGVTQVGSNNANNGGTGSNLAVTGSTIRPFVTGGVLLVALGALLVLGVRRRRED